MGSMTQPRSSSREKGPSAGPGLRGNADAIVFLLAHQDDELMLAPLIADAKREGRPVYVLFLTNGDGGEAPPEARNDETRCLLQTLGVDVSTEVAFVGDRLAVSDGELFKRMLDVHAAVAELLSGLAVETIYVHAWEGGNPDHDAAHALGLGIAATLGLTESIYQVPFYRAPRRGPLPFVLFAPLAANGPTAFYRLRLGERLRRLSLVRYFPSQMRTVLRFWPFMLLDALLRPGVPIQRANASRLEERPMPEPLRYERIGYVEFSAMAPQIARYWQTVAGGGAASEPCSLGGNCC